MPEALVSTAEAACSSTDTTVLTISFLLAYCDRRERKTATLNRLADLVRDAMSSSQIVPQYVAEISIRQACTNYAEVEFSQDGV